MAIANKTTIAFSLVSVPISMYTATQDNDISFNQLHPNYKRSLINNYIHNLDK